MKYIFSLFLFLICGSTMTILPVTIDQIKKEEAQELESIQWIKERYQEKNSFFNKTGKVLNKGLEWIFLPKELREEISKERKEQALRVERIHTRLMVDILKKCINAPTEKKEHCEKVKKLAEEIEQEIKKLI